MRIEKKKNHSEELLHAADKLIKRIQKADEMEAAEVEASFRVVMGRVRKEKFVPSYRRIYRWTAAAAVIAIALFGYLYEISEEQPSTTFDIALLDQNPLSISDNEVTLVTDQSAMNLKDSTSLEYDKTGASNAQQYLLNKINQVAQSEKTKTHQIIVPKGKRANVTLSDGTKIYVNSGSKIIYPELFEGDKREVLVEGEVYLEVAANKKCPFIVKTRNFDIEVLGTAFNICAYREEKDASVVLVHGSVEVTTENKSKKQLKPNQLMSIHGNQASISQVDVSEYISWKDNLLLMERKSLSQIFAKLERYYGCTISSSQEIASMSLSGKLDLHSSITNVMDNLCLLLSLDYTVNNNQEFIVSFKKESL